MIKDTVEKVKELIGSRALAYKRVFKNEDASTRIVLEDLAKFCRATESAYDKDPRVHAVLEGRREVFLRISNYLHLTGDELIKLYGRP